jgi:hypothetical protein
MVAVCPSDIKDAWFLKVNVVWYRGWCNVLVHYLTDSITFCRMAAKLHQKNNIYEAMNTQNCHSGISLTNQTQLINK